MGYLHAGGGGGSPTATKKCQSCGGEYEHTYSPMSANLCPACESKRAEAHREEFADFSALQDRWTSLRDAGDLAGQFSFLAKSRRLYLQDYQGNRHAMVVPPDLPSYQRLVATATAKGQIIVPDYDAMI